MSEEQIKAVLGDLWHDGDTWEEERLWDPAPSIKLGSDVLEVYVWQAVGSEYVQSATDNECNPKCWYVFTDEFYGRMDSDRSRSIGVLFTRAAKICDRLNEWQKDNA